MRKSARYKDRYERILLRTNYPHQGKGRRPFPALRVVPPQGFVDLTRAATVAILTG